MTELAIGRDRVGRQERTGGAASSGADEGRVLQLALAAAWLLDGMLRYQSSMYTPMFGQMIGDTATGNPGVVASPISWNAALVQHHLVLLNTVFATIQLLLGLGIAYRPTVRVALAASIAWSLAVWWLGEGLGGVLSGGASPVSGGPGAVVLYALLAVLLWPTGRTGMAGWSAGGPPALRAPTLALAFALLLIGFTVRDLDRRASVDGYFRAAGRRLAPAAAAVGTAAARRESGAGPVPAAEPAPQPGPAERLLLSPAVVKGCQVTTGVTMALTLIMMI